MTHRLLWISLFYGIMINIFTSVGYCHNIMQNASESHSERFASLSRMIKCMVCSGESIDESQSAFASIMRDFIHKKIKDGDSDEEILNRIRTKYGETIILKPSFNFSTLLLWLFPYLALLIALTMLWIKKNKRYSSTH